MKTVIKLESLQKNIHEAATGGCGVNYKSGGELFLLECKRLKVTLEQDKIMRVVDKMGGHSIFSGLGSLQLEGTG